MRWEGLKRLDPIDIEKLIFQEIKDKKMRQKDIAQTYACLIAEEFQEKRVDWEKINKSIIERWSLSGLTRIKNMAHSGKCFE